MKKILLSIGLLVCSITSYLNGLPNQSGTYQSPRFQVRSSPIIYKSSSIAPTKLRVIQVGTLAEIEANSWQIDKRNYDPVTATYAHEVEAPATKVQGRALYTTNPQRVQELGQSKTTFYHEIPPRQLLEPKKGIY